MNWRAVAIFSFISIGPIFSNLSGIEIKYCYIKDPAKHQANQALLRNIIEDELASSSDKDEADFLRERIFEIAKSLLRKGFSFEAYGLPECDPHSPLSFNCFVLWEGAKECKNAVPITFFVYAWPSERYALEFNSSNCRYASLIHSHPIPCAFVVLQGELSQKNYEQARDSQSNKALFAGEQIFKAGEGEVDDLSKPFIHQMYNKGKSSPLCLSLHAYGLESEKEVMQCFKETMPEHSYLEENDKR